MSKYSLWAVFFLLSITSVFAGGKSEPYQSVEGQENWHFNYDISKMETGKYNLIIQAEDKAGNIRVEGPFNINVDPNSDIPLISINSPTPGWRTTGKLNIVGSAVDDDQVDFVEVQLGTEGAVNRAVGTKYWSYYLDMTTLEDGPYMIRARSFDINGKSSPWATVNFHLDQFKPLIKVTSHEMGSLVKGGIKLSGEVFEPNGISEFYYSIGNQDNYQKTSATLSPDKKQFNFSLDVDTKKLTDGSQIVWLKAVNPLGNEGLASFLFFVDNTGPKVELYRPLTNQGSPGDLYLAGAVQEGVGLKSLTWSIDDKKGEIQLIPGNPYWLLNLDFSSGDAREKKIRFVAEDKIGNIGTEEFALIIDREGDRPILTLDNPKVKDRLKGTFQVRGWIQDDDGAQSVTWNLTGGQKGTLESTGIFQFDLKPSQAGPQILSLTAKDIKGVESKQVQVAFDYIPDAPVIVLDKVAFGTKEEIFRPGFLYPSENPGEKKQFLKGHVLSMDKLNQINFYLPNSATMKKPESYSLTPAGQGTYSFTIPLSEKVGLGRNNFNLNLKDSFGSEATLNSFILAAFNDLYDAEASNKVFFLEDDSLQNSKINLRENESLKVLFYSEKAESTATPGQNYEIPSLVEFIPKTDLFTLEQTPINNNGYILTIKSQGSGVTPATRIKITTESGKTFESSFTLILNSDFKAPEFTITSPVPGFWAQKSLALQGNIQLPITDLSLMEYSLDGTLWLKLPPNVVKDAPKIAPVSGRAAINFQKSAEDLALIDTLIDVSGLSDGPQILHLRSTDNSGNTQALTIPFFKDTELPVIAIVAPMEGIKVNGMTTIIGEWKDNGGLKSMEYSDDGKKFIPLEAKPRFKVDIDFSKYLKVPDRFYFRGTDLSGNVNSFETIFIVDLEIDKPVVNLQIPGPGEVLRSDFYISGLVLDDDGVKEVSYRIDGKGDFIILEASNSFQVPVSLSNITDTKHFVEVFAVDLNGTRGPIQRQDFVVSRSGPVSLLTKPDVKITQRGKVVLEGTSEDPNGVELVLISFDNGNTFYKMRGTSNWSYLLDTSIVADGIYTVMIRAIDTTGAVGDYSVLFSLDNTPPKLNLTSPKDGAVYAESIPLEGRGSDAVNLAVLKYSIKALESSAAALTGTLPVGQAFTTNIPLTGLKAGWYNLSVEAFDDAGNITLLARNIEVVDAVEADKVELFFPVQGHKISGPFKVQGRYFSKKVPEKIVLKINGNIFSTVAVDSYGYFSGSVNPSELFPLLKNQNPLPLTSESLSLQVEGGEGAIKVQSTVRQVDYQAQGPWVLVDSHSMGDFITNRPYMKGRLGFFALVPPVPAEGELPMTYLYGEKQITLEQIQNLPVTLELSMDNGMSFKPLLKVWDGNEKGTKEWEYRLETQEFQQGALTLLIKATFGDGSVATTRQILTTDTQAPLVELLVPAEEGRFNEELKIVGAASDENGLKSVRVSLRKGDKVFTQVPSFIQGMYYDLTFLGATVYSTGVGVTFFDQAVKIQVNIGQFPKEIPEFAGGGESRLFGWVYGGKLLANIVTLPFGFFFGPDWEWLGVNGAVGANFAAFSKDMNSLVSPNLNVMSAIIGQFEVKASANLPALKAYSIFYELSSWFIPSEVKPEVMIQHSVGFRITLL